MHPTMLPFFGLHLAVAVVVASVAAASVVVVSAAVVAIVVVSPVPPPVASSCLLPPSLSPTLRQSFLFSFYERRLQRTTIYLRAHAYCPYHP